jgi:hypothetical protein
MRTVKFLHGDTDILTYQGLWNHTELMKRLRGPLVACWYCRCVALAGLIVVLSLTTLT